MSKEHNTTEQEYIFTKTYHSKYFDVLIKKGSTLRKCNRPGKLEVYNEMGKSVGFWFTSVDLLKDYIQKVEPTTEKGSAFLYLLKEKQREQKENKATEQGRQEPQTSFYCRAWDREGYKCDEQCQICNKAENMPETEPEGRQGEEERIRKIMIKKSVPFSDGSRLITDGLQMEAAKAIYSEIIEPLKKELDNYKQSYKYAFEDMNMFRVRSIDKDKRIQQLEKWNERLENKIKFFLSSNETKEWFMSELQEVKQQLASVTKERDELKGYVDSKI